MDHPDALCQEVRGACSGCHCSSTRTDSLYCLQGVKQARSVFTKARKSPYLAWQVVEASGELFLRPDIRSDADLTFLIATMEFFWNNDPKVATNVFELGLKTFSKEPEYVLQYLDYLIRTNNPNSRSLTWLPISSRRAYS